ncbi:MAG TPA: TolC family protein [Longimicrobiaceae bacterium]|nr:TolC family protein [Longimicrobiaceae bacterium]
MRKWIAILILTVVVGPGGLAAQEVTADSVGLSLEEAVQRATGQSEEIRLARSQVDLASSQVTSARSAAFPQLNLNLGYTRTLASAFDTGGEAVEIPDSLKFNPDPTAPLEERVTYLENNAQKAAFGGLSGLFGNLPFGQENAYSFTFSGSQLLYSGGRVGAALDIAESFEEAARLTLNEEMAEIELQVRSAYYTAQLAQELQTISAAALEQAELFLEQERLRLRAGRASELEVMRAEVSRDNLRPPLVQARNAADLAKLNLKRLVDIPLTQPIQLTTALEPPPPDATALPAPEVRIAQRAAVQAAQQQVAIREQQVRIAKGAFLPEVSLQMNYGKQLFPESAFDFDSDWRTDWSVGIGVQIPVFNGFRRAADVDIAQVELAQSRLQLAQLEESVRLQYEQARGEKERALAAIAARQRTVDVAQRVYDLTVLRYEQGVATQLEVSESRLALLQARTNLAQATADYYIADAGLTRSMAEANPDAMNAPPVTQPVRPQPVQQDIPGTSRRGSPVGSIR